jgi:hypothetical protein
VRQRKRVRLVPRLWRSRRVGVDDPAFTRWSKLCRACGAAFELEWLGRSTWPGGKPGRYKGNCKGKALLARVAFFFGVEEFGEARIFLKEGEIFVIAGVVAIFAAQVDGDL